MTPTPRQLQYLRAIVSFQDRHGFSPTIRELGNALGMASTNGVAEQLHLIRRKGLLDWRINKARTLALTARGWRELGLKKKEVAP
jgi:repressor LexA